MSQAVPDADPVVVEVVNAGGTSPAQWILALLPVAAAIVVLHLGNRDERKQKTRSDRLAAYAILLDRTGEVHALLVGSLDGTEPDPVQWLQANGAMAAGLANAKMLSTPADSELIERATEGYKDEMRRLLRESRHFDEAHGDEGPVARADRPSLQSNESGGPESVSGERYPFEAGARAALARLSEALVPIATRA